MPDEDARDAPHGVNASHSSTHDTDIFPSLAHEARNIRHFGQPIPSEENLPTLLSPASDRPTSTISGISGPTEQDTHSHSLDHEHEATPSVPRPTPLMRSLGVQTQVVVVKHGELPSS